MLSMQLQKSHAILHGRLQFVRSRLLGQPLPRAKRLVRDQQKQRLFYNKASSLASKYRQPAIAKTELSTPVAGAVLPVEKLPESTPAKPAFRFPEIVRPDEELTPLETFSPTPTVETAPTTPTEPTKPVTPTIVVRSGKPVRQTIFAILMGLSFTLLVLLFGPLLYFRFVSHEAVPVQTQEVGTPLGGEFSPPVQAERKMEKPPQEEGLPEGNWLSIPRIGVRTEILESEIPEESLIKGVWRVPDFGQPGDTDEPMILAAHRYGYNWWWKGEYWKYHSFNLLPELEPGDLVEVVSDKRKYLYEIYAGQEGTEIDDYNADLILYTCKFLNSDIRHVRYARLIDPSKYSDYQ